MIPLVVDLDGSLLRSDLLLEGVFALLAERPAAMLAGAAYLPRGRAAFKRWVAGQASLDISILPYSDAVLAEIAAARAEGREVWLVSASDAHLVQAVADHLGCFDGVMGSDGRLNLKGENKARALVEKFGAGGFDYIGNETADWPIWSQARQVLVAHPGARFLRRVVRRFPQARATGIAGGWRDRVRALRPHQWLKNLLVFLPVLATHDFRERDWFSAFLAFVALSLVASSLYVVNDLIDLGRDRAHPTKRNRPFASGRVALAHGLLMVPLLLFATLAVSWLLPPLALVVLVGYAVASLSYSVWLKRVAMIDVVMLACLYGSRLVLGSVSGGGRLTGWLAAFSLFLFFSLALVKRMTELAHKRDKGGLAGRGYEAGDEPLIAALAGASGMVSILVFALYVNSADVRVLYRAPSHLWFVCVVLLFWIGRIQLLAHRGKLDADPLIFAATDKVSLASIAVAALIVVSAL